MNNIPINSASVRVMRSFDYSHFEITLGCNADAQGNPVSLSPADVDNLRKNAARLADKAVAQYKVAKAAHQAEESSWDSMRYAAEQAEKTPESERTPEEKAAIKALGDLCLICSKPVPDYDPKYCCNGIDCGCMGQPTEPCVCSPKCYDALMSGIGKTYEQRRQDAGIAVWSPNHRMSDGL